MKGIHTYVFHPKSYRVRDWPVNWLGNQSIHFHWSPIATFDWLLIEATSEFTIELVLIVSILIIGFSEGTYRPLINRFPIIDVMMPTVVLYAILVGVITLLVTR